MAVLKSIGACAALALLATPGSATAQDTATGRWVISGHVTGFDFTLNCRFEQTGAVLGGVCVDGATSDPSIKSGRKHVLTMGQVTGDHVAFTYQSSFLLKRFNVDYAGVRQGGHMSGQINVPGRSGPFTAERTGP
jgi:hypothetical protein